MATVRKSNSDWGGKPFWGLVQQNGPWATTPTDIKRANMKDVGTYGGGIGVGGRGHAGHSTFASFINPYQVNATGAPPAPSGYARPTVIMGSVDMKRSTKTGKVKKGLTLAARTPIQTGHKMGNAREENTRQEDGDIMPPIVVEGTNQFGSTHHIMEMPPLMSASDVSIYGSSTPAYINDLATGSHNVVYNASYGETDSHVSGYSNAFGRSEQIKPPVTLGRSEQTNPRVSYGFNQNSRNLNDRDSSASSSSSTAATSLGSMASLNTPMPDPILTYYPIEQIIPEPVDYPVEYQSPDIVDTTMTQNLDMSQAFLDSIANYDNGKYTQMQKKRDSQINEKPVPVPIKGFKKNALDGTFLAEEANRGLTAGLSNPMSEKTKGKRPMPIVTSPTEASSSKPKTPSPVRKSKAKSKSPTDPKPVPKTKPGPSKPAAKKVPTRGRPATRGEDVSRNRSKSPGGPVKVKYQRVTAKGAAALYKRFGYKIKDRFESMKEDDVQYKITKAAYELYKNDK
jgi:hypothetical protein